MSDAQAPRPRPAGETGGSDQRPPQRLSSPLLHFDLTQERERLCNEESYRTGDRNARTLVKEDGLRVVLTVMREGARLIEHKTAGALAIQTLSGRIRLGALESTVEMTAGHIAVLEKEISHEVEALEDSAFLLTITSA
jgi:quercetin dioxygenase-like cupin family protein